MRDAAPPSTGASASQGAYPLAAAHPRPGPGELTACALVLAWIIGLGCLNLYMPFASDHGMFLLGAKAVARGEVLYVDFWDNKMPGLIWFYWAAGELFGYDEAGIRTLELIYLVTFSIVMMVTLRRDLQPPWLVAVAPMTVVSVYYAAALSFELTMLEFLTAFPIYLSLWCASRCRELSRSCAWYGFASGVLAGVTVSFKLVFAPIFAVAWAVVALYLLRERDQRQPMLPFLRDLALRAALPVAAGLALVLGAIAVKFWLDDALDELLWAAFSYPAKALALIEPAPTRRRVETIAYYLSYYLPWLGFVVLAGIDWWRRERGLWTALLFVWLLVGYAVIAVQNFSWWTYHALIVFTPTGLLGVMGVSATLAWLGRHGLGQRRYAAALFVAICLPALTAQARPTFDKARALTYALLDKEGSVFDYQVLVRPVYKELRETTAFLDSARAEPGPIYVFGDPLIYHFSNRRPASPMPGYFWNYFLQEQWVDLAGQLAAADPPYIYISQAYSKGLVQRGAGVWQHIIARYRVKTSDSRGLWFERKR